MKSSKQTSPLKELNQLLESVQNDPSTLERTEVKEEGEIVPGVQGTGIFHYSDLEELMKSINVPRPCPIHYGQMEELKSKKEDNHDVFWTCPQNCAFFCPEKEYEVYYYNCR